MKASDLSFTVIEIKVTRSIIYKGDFAPIGKVFYIAYLKGKGLHCAEVRYLINKLWEDEQTEDGVKKAIRLELQKQLNIAIPVDDPETLEPTGNDN
jgi:hypothetical protein